MVFSLKACLTQNNIYLKLFSDKSFSYVYVVIRRTNKLCTLNFHIFFSSFSLSFNPLLTGFEMFVAWD